MDTITHGIAGALIGKAFIKGDDMFALRPMNRGRVVTWATMLGAIFPDSDTFRDVLSHNDMLMITWHRSITHSLFFLPLFALLLAGLTRSLTRWRKWDAPSFAALAGIYAVGILSHILLDLVTTFGTMIWSPAKWSRPAWDLIFIVDFTFTGILLVPQILAWVQERPKKSRRRALACLAIFVLAIALIQRLGAAVGVPISNASVLLFVVILGGLFMLPLPSSQITTKSSNSAGSQDAESLSDGNKNSSPTKIRKQWNRAGFAGACAYLALAVFAHHSALARVKSFAALQKLDVQSLAALPFPPSPFRWDGLVLTSRGAYEIRLDLTEKSPFKLPTNPQEMDRAATDLSAVEYRFYPQAQPNAFIATAKDLPEVKKVLWFDRFPVTRFHEEGGESIVEISDMRFPQIRKNRAAPFTYRIVLDPTGKVLSQAWAK